MTNRMLIGNNPYVGDSGVFISKPGRDISDTTTNYLLDSRFRTLARHANGRVRASKTGQGSGHAFQTWYVETTFPDLGYVPIFQASFVYSNSTDYGIPANSAYIPTAGGARIHPSGGFSMQACGAWIVGTNTLRAGMRTNGNNGIYDLDFDLVYIIFKNRFGE